MLYCCRWVCLKRANRVSIARPLGRRGWGLSPGGGGGARLGDGVPPPQRLVGAFTRHVMAANGRSFFGRRDVAAPSEGCQWLARLVGGPPGGGGRFGVIWVATWSATLPQGNYSADAKTLCLIYMVCYTKWSGTPTMYTTKCGSIYCFPQFRKFYMSRCGYLEVFQRVP